MIKQVFGYTNNGNFPIRYVKRKYFYPKDVGNDTFENEIISDSKSESRKNSLANLTAGFETKGVSSTTAKKIATACRVLSYASEKRILKNEKGNKFEHLVLFVTLTLPSAQVHEDAWVTKHVLGSFLDKCRKFGNFSNYVWRAEKQKNGNIHYHLLTDSYMPFAIIRNFWYTACRVGGYMQAFKEKFSSMSHQMYASQPFNKGVNPIKVAQRYAKGVREKWSRPPSVDVEQVSSAGGVSKYISKYVSKNSATSENIVKGRVWACSSSVSKAVEIFKKDDHFNRFWFDYSNEILKKKVFHSDFFSVVKCSFVSLSAWSPDVGKYIIDRLHEVFTPCNQWVHYCPFVAPPML